MKFSYVLFLMSVLYHLCLIFCSSLFCLFETGTKSSLLRFFYLTLFQLSGFIFAVLMVPFALVKWDGKKRFCDNGSFFDLTEKLVTLFRYLSSRRKFPQSYDLMIEWSIMFIDIVCHVVQATRLRCPPTASPQKSVGEICCICALKLPSLLPFEKA